MNKRACSILGVAAFLIGGTQLFASDFPPAFDSDDLGSASITQTAPMDITIADFVESAGSDLDLDDVLLSSDANDADAAGVPTVVLNSDAAPATIVSNVGIFTPEPGSIAMLLLGAAGMALGVFRRRR